MFLDRHDAGQKLATSLEKYKPENPFVLAIPRGGIIVAAEVAKMLELDFSILVSRKLPHPRNPETGFGAIAEDGSIYLIENVDTFITNDHMASIVEIQKQVIQERIAVLRNSKPFPVIAGRNVILVDDGIAMGSTMIASVKMCYNQKAAKIIVAVPVAGERSIHKLQMMVNDIVVLETPFNFRAVAQVYYNWHDVSDQEAIEILSQFPKLLSE